VNDPIALIADALRNGDPIVLPTDTVYGLAALAADRDAVAKIFAVKKRPVDIRIAVLVTDLAQAEEFVEMSPVARCLAEAFWPGALTIVAPRRPGCALAVGDETSVGVRCPDHPLVRELARREGPIAATSANRHGQPTPTTAADVAAIFPKTGMIIDGGRIDGSASTVVSVMGDVAVLRQGSVTSADIDAVLKRNS
jgi:L-threonylcarbamoyladenylate synthase